ncbi:MAG: hypothetical protein ACXACA_01740, partial [Candidatus Ranarchaeia archaeon]
IILSNSRKVSGKVYSLLWSSKMKLKEKLLLPLCAEISSRNNRRNRYKLLSSFKDANESGKSLLPSRKSKCNKRSPVKSV